MLAVLSEHPRQGFKFDAPLWRRGFSEFYYVLMKLLLQLCSSLYCRVTIAANYVL
jgi:hypothetical protein